MTPRLALQVWSFKVCGRMCTPWITSYGKKGIVNFGFIVDSVFQSSEVDQIRLGSYNKLSAGLRQVNPVHENGP